MHAVASTGRIYAPKRLQAACITMMKIQLDANSLTVPLMNDFGSALREVRKRLVVKRNTFECVFRDLIAARPLDPALDRTVYRLPLLTLLNNLSGRRGPELMNPEEIGRQIVCTFHHEATVS